MNHIPFELRVKYLKSGHECVKAGKQLRWFVAMLMNITNAVTLFLLLSSVYCYQFRSFLIAKFIYFFLLHFVRCSCRNQLQKKIEAKFFISFFSASKMNIKRLAIPMLSKKASIHWNNKKTSIKLILENRNLFLNRTAISFINHVTIY